MYDLSTASPLTQASAKSTRGSYRTRKTALRPPSTPASASVELNRADSETQLLCSSPGGGERLSVTEQLRAHARLLAPKEVAKLLGVHQETIYVLMTEDGMPSIRIGRSRRVDSVLLAAWLEERSS